MRTPYLIQRAKFTKQSSEAAIGIDRILRFDYMGSSEFEFDALPKSLRYVRENIHEYHITSMNIKDKKIVVHCHMNNTNEVKDYIRKIAEGSLQLKEYSDFDNYINPGGFLKNATDFWWDIENHFMFWKNDIIFTTNFICNIDNGQY